MTCLRRQAQLAVSAGFLLTACSASALYGQEIRAVGGVLGPVRSQQVWTPLAQTTPRDGWAIGAFVDVALPPSALSVLAEALLVQRGTSLTVDVGAGSTRTEAESDYLAFPILLKVRYFRDVAGLYLLAGPTIEYLLRTRAHASLGAVYGFEKTSSLGVTVGGGVEGLIRSRVAVMAEVRWTEGLTNAYEGEVARVRHRSLEMLLRVGIRPQSETPAR